MIRTTLYCVLFLTVYALGYAQVQTAISLAELQQSKGISVMIFLKEQCPICQKYAPTFRELYQRFASDGIRFFGIFPDRTPDTLAIHDYCKEYGLPFPIHIDSTMEWTEYADARITPEVAVIIDGHIVYAGKIDDWFISWGRKKNAPRHHILADLLTNLQQGKPIKQSRTQAIGCAIAR